MKALIFGLLFSSTLLAGELSPRIFEVIGSYESETARNADSYMANDLSSFNILITPDSQAVVEFEEWGLEIDLDKDLEFYESTVSECEDPGCSGVSEIEGKITFKHINGKDIPFAKVTMYFYADTSEDVDCDEVDCDDLDYDDYWKEWEETYEFEFSGAFAGQLPAFKPTELNTELATNLSQCRQVTKGTFLKCASASQFKFEQEINEETLKKLSEYLYAGFNTALDKASALKLLKTQLDNVLLQAKTFTFNGEETEAYQAIKQNLVDFLLLIESVEVDSVMASINRVNSWRANANMDFLLINKATKEVTRLKLEF